MSHRTFRGYLARILCEISNEDGTTERPNRCESNAGTSRDNPVFVENINEDWHSKEKTHRTHEKAYWYIGLFFTFLIMLFTGFGAGFAYSAYCETRRQADIALEALIDNDRPIIIVSVVESDKITNNTEVPSISIANIGTKPAVVDFGQTRIDIDKKIDFKDSNMLDECVVMMGYHVIKPGDSINFKCFPRRDVTDNIAAHKEEILYGIVFYKSITTGVRWRKSFGFHYRPDINIWGDDGQVNSNVETRVDRDGTPIKPFISE